MPKAHLLLNSSSIEAGFGVESFIEGTVCVDGFGDNADDVVVGIEFVGKTETLWTCDGIRKEGDMKPFIHSKQFLSVSETLHQRTSTSIPFRLALPRDGVYPSSNDTRHSVQYHVKATVSWNGPDPGVWVDKVSVVVLFPSIAIKQMLSDPSSFKFQDSFGRFAVEIPKRVVCPGDSVDVLFHATDGQIGSISCVIASLQATCVFKGPKTSDSLSLDRPIDLQCINAPSNHTTRRISLFLDPSITKASIHSPLTSITNFIRIQVKFIETHDVVFNVPIVVVPRTSRGSTHLFQNFGFVNQNIKQEIPDTTLIRLGSLMHSLRIEAAAEDDVPRLTRASISSRASSSTLSLLSNS